MTPIIERYPLYSITITVARTIKTVKVRDWLAIFVIIASGIRTAMKTDQNRMRIFLIVDGFASYNTLSFCSLIMPHPAD